MSEPRHVHHSGLAALDPSLLADLLEYAPACIDRLIGTGNTMLLVRLKQIGSLACSIPSHLMQHFTRIRTLKLDGRLACRDDDSDDDEDEDETDFTPVLGVLPMEVSIHWSSTLRSLSLVGNNLWTLPKAFEGLSRLERLDFSHNNLYTLEGIEHLTSLKFLKLNHNTNIALRANELSALTALETLKMAHCDCRNLPEGLTKLANLTSLCVHGNTSLLRHYSASNETASWNLINGITTLHKLCVRRCSISSGTHLHFFTHPHLEKLKLDGNYFGEWPFRLASMSTLTKLTMSKCLLKSLPTDLSAHGQLTTLDLSDNDQQVLLPSIGQLTSLTSLNLSRNPFLYAFPIELGNLTRLRELVAVNSNLTWQALPPEAAHLTNLQSLCLTCWPSVEYVDDDDVVVVDGEAAIKLNEEAEITTRNIFSYLSMLKQVKLSSSSTQHGDYSLLETLYCKDTLDLSNCAIGTLPQSFGCYLGSLSWLKLDNCRRQVDNALEPLPLNATHLKRLVSLEVLILSSNTLTWDDLSAEFVQAMPSSLRSLDLSHNVLSRLPPGLDHLSQLNILLLDRNQITALPTDFGTHFPRLVSLNLSCNQLTLVPSSLGSISSLEYLSLKNNKIGELPEDLFVGMTRLERLELDKNELSCIPANISSLVSLRTLTLAANQLTAITSVLADMTSLRQVDLRKNKIPNLDPHVVIRMDAFLETLKLTGNPVATRNQRLLKYISY